MAPRGTQLWVRGRRPRGAWLRGLVSWVPYGWAVSITPRRLVLMSWLGAGLACEVADAIARLVARGARAVAQHMREGGCPGERFAAPEMQGPAPTLAPCACSSQQMNQAAAYSHRLRLYLSWQSASFQQASVAAVGGCRWLRKFGQTHNTQRAAPTGD